MKDSGSIVVKWHHSEIVEEYSTFNPVSRWTIDNQGPVVQSPMKLNLD